MYKSVIRPIFFAIDAEKIHHLVFSSLKKLQAVPGVKKLFQRKFEVASPSLEKKLFGLTFPNPVGLAAGFDKDARAIDELAAIGFGFIEIGTLTPKAQPGNDKPRLFRLPQDQALINRMGFNNEGVEASIARLKAKKSGIIVGGNIGKNKQTANENALDDYGYCIEKLHPYVDYFVVNVSSPNTPGLRELQEKEPLRKLLLHAKKLASSKTPSRPVLLKIAPDLTDEQLTDIVEILKSTGIDGVIATNTTISRDGLQTMKDDVLRIGAGGLSGKPLRERATAVVRYLRDKLGPQYPIIGVGGIMTPSDAVERIEAGADLLQIYTGFIYEGPSIVRRINELLQRRASVIRIFPQGQE
jgi:dihydroorotate dehydrogenase